MNRQPKGSPRTVVATAPPGPRAQDSSAEHRRRLEELFSKGGQQPASAPRSTPSADAERVFANPRKSLGRSPSEYRLRLERLRIARGEEIPAAVDAFLQHHQLPDDVDILYKVLEHTNESVLREALGQIASLLMQGRIGSTVILEDKLADLAGRAKEPATLSYVDGLRQQIAQRKK